MRDMLYWECKRRLEILRQFRIVAVEYFDNTQIVGHGRRRTDLMNEDSQKARNRMNTLIEDVCMSLDLVRVSYTVFYQPPPMVGGYAQPVDVIRNAFALWEFPISSTKIFDSIDRAIGVYEGLGRKLFRSLFNPFYWIGILFVFVIRLPFQLLKAAGFDAGKIERSLPGKLVKVFIGVVTGIVALTASLIEIADHWPIMQAFFRDCARVWAKL